MTGRGLALTLILSSASMVTSAPPNPGESRQAVRALRAALAAPVEGLADLAGRDFSGTPLTRADSATVRELLWQAYSRAARKQCADEMKQKNLKDGELSMLFDFKVFGPKPKAGHSLWISMHGGGGAPRQVNDQQWDNQKKLYMLEEGIYVVPRAPTDTWNLWHQPHIDRLFARLIQNMIVCEGIDPNRVYLMGYSAGGDGVYQLAPRMADRLAAAAMMAGHPNGVSLLSLRNVPFALQVGGKDAAYNRNRVAAEYGAELDKLAKADPGGYKHLVKIHEGKPHWMDGDDKLALPWMAKCTRNPTPERIVWKQTGVAYDSSYWLSVPRSEAVLDSLVIVERKDQAVEITEARGVKRLVIYLDDRMLDLDKTVIVMFRGKKLFEGSSARTIETMITTLGARGDPKLMFDACVTVDLKGE